LLAFVGSGRRVTQAVRLAPGDVVALARALDAREPAVGEIRSIDDLRERQKDQPR
jgi:hypothetical protein